MPKERQNPKPPSRQNADAVFRSAHRYGEHWAPKQLMSALTADLADPEPLLTHPSAQAWSWQDWMHCMIAMQPLSAWQAVISLAHELTPQQSC